ncbi:SpoIID/LytB domain-containing protein [Oscillatoria sp. FACHB-1406]|uniref:SpoIID/LytB domain-containing protein n=1 Tax=Oscillatoria sp. FACHB-1406 TaxID=2692846 RepID=UPI001686F87A|nr:SpoIID/LytB domain-containing protein [Oscillatoria sp. FACHB-1406]MBD2576667.1 SpoIID/LytB domain-containing protein [Oscillatoria sp. FACHB-1406]
MKAKPRSFERRFFPLLSAFPLLILWGVTVSLTGKPEALELQVGVVQRFGDEPTDLLTLSSTEGDTLRLEFLAGNSQSQTIATKTVKLEIKPQPQAEPYLKEWIVLSDHATFETAEASAKQWREKNIEVEITQPARWQVWAKRDVYSTPLLRRLLLEDLKAKGETSPYLKSEVVKEIPQVSFAVNGYRYTRNEIEITSAKNAVRVSEGADGKNAYTYGGSLKIQPNAYGDFTLVNRVPLETYLRGVVPHEIGASSPYASIEAQTILARTYALRNLRRFKADNYQLCATVHCQVYRGLTGTAESTDRAIAATRGQVLTYNNELIDALYSANSGGVTAKFNDIWDGEERPYLQGKIDAPTAVWDLTKSPLSDEKNLRRFLSLKTGFNGSEANLFRWDRSRTLPEVIADFNRYLDRIQHPFNPVSRIDAIQVKERSLSGHILEMDVKTDKGIVQLHKTEARSAFEPPRSSLFYVDPILDADKSLKGYRFVGGGFGHGAGMSQYGSYNLAKLGWTSAQILQFYFPGTTLEPLNDSIVFYPEN